jgi:hypothetical protein
MPEAKKTLSISPALQRLSDHVQPVGLSLNDFLRLALLQPPEAWTLLPYLDEAALDPAGRAPRYGFRLPPHAWAEVEALVAQLRAQGRPALSLSQVVRALLLWTAEGILEHWPD